MMPDYALEYRPLPIMPPEVARVSVGFTIGNHLAVKVQASKRVLLLPGLEEKFGRAAAAFVEEFSKDNPLLAASRDVGYNADLDQATNRLAQEHGVPFTNNHKDVS